MTDEATAPATRAAPRCTQRGDRRPRGALAGAPSSDRAPLSARATARARSPRSSTCRAARSTRGCAAGSTRWRSGSRSWTVDLTRQEGGSPSSARPTRPGPRAVPGRSSARPTSSASRWRRGTARGGRLAVAPAAAVIIAALALSPAGASVGRFITRALGEQHAAPALFSLPTPWAESSSPGPAGRGPRPPTARRGASVPGRRRVGRHTGCSWWSHRGTGWRRSTHRHRSLGAGAAGGQRSELVFAERLPGRVSVGRHAPVLTRATGPAIGSSQPGSRMSRRRGGRERRQPYELAYVTARGRVVVRDGDTGRIVWSTAPGPRGP